MPDATIIPFAPHREARVAAAELADHSLRGTVAALEQQPEYQAALGTLRRRPEETELRHVERLLAWAYAQTAGDLLVVIGFVGDAAEREAGRGGG